MIIKNNLVYAVIPARSGSKAIKNKNIVDINGHPLIAHSIVVALKSKMIERVIVSTDSKLYANIAIKYGAEVPFLRPSNLSTDNSTDLDFFLHLIQSLIDKEEILPEFFVHLRPTTPLREVDKLDEAVSLFKNKYLYSSLRSCHRMEESSYKNFEIKKNTLVSTFSLDKNLDKFNSPRQNFPITYRCNGYIDIVRTKNIVNKNLLHGDKVFPFVTQNVHEVDNDDDLLYLRYLYSSNKFYKKIFNKNFSQNVKR